MEMVARGELVARLSIVLITCIDGEVLLPSWRSALPRGALDARVPMDRAFLHRLDAVGRRSRQAADVLMDGSPTRSW